MSIDPVAVISEGVKKLPGGRFKLDRFEGTGWVKWDGEIGFTWPKAMVPFEAIAPYWVVNKLVGGPYANSGFRFRIKYHNASWPPAAQMDHPYLLPCMSVEERDRITAIQTTIKNFQTELDQLLEPYLQEQQKLKQSLIEEFPGSDDLHPTPEEYNPFIGGGGGGIASSFVSGFTSQPMPDPGAMLLPVDTEQTYYSGDDDDEDEL